MIYIQLGKVIVEGTDLRRIKYFDHVKIFDCDRPPSL